MEKASTFSPETQTHQEKIMALLAQQGIRNMADLAPDPSSEDDFRQMDVLDMLEVIENSSTTMEKSCSIQQKIQEVLQQSYKNKKR